MAETDVIKKELATEGSHWYDIHGEPHHTIIGANGKERATTLRDAKKQGWVPSVNTVLGILAKPGLEIWKQKNVLLASLTLPKIDGESEDQYIERIILDAKDQSIKASELGTAIHGAIEKYLMGETIDNQYLPYIMPVINWLDERGHLADRKVEHSFFHPLGFGGKIDFHNESVIIDFKTTRFSDATKNLSWDEHIYQLGGYRLGLQRDYKLVNIYISTEVAGLFKIHEWDEAEARRGMTIFMMILDLWKTIKYK